MGEENVTEASSAEENVAEASGPEVQVKTAPATSVMCIEHRGPYTELESVLDELITWVMREGHPYSAPPFAILYDDPQYVPEADLRSDVCVPMEEEVGGKDRVIRRELPALTVVSSVHKGPYHDVHKAYEVIFDYLKQNNHEYQVAYGCREVYINSPVDVSDEELLTEVQVPIGKAVEK